MTAPESLFQVRVTYWIEARADAKRPWVAWFESEDEDALREQLARLRREYPSPQRGWRFGRTTKTVEVLDA